MGKVRPHYHVGGLRGWGGGVAARPALLASKYMTASELLYIPRVGTGSRSRGRLLSLSTLPIRIRAERTNTMTFPNLTLGHYNFGGEAKHDENELAAIEKNGGGEETREEPNIAAQTTQIPRTPRKP